MKTPFPPYIGLLVLLTVGSASGQNLLNGPQGVVYDSVSHRMLLTNFTDGTIVRVDSNHQQSYFQTGLGNCMYSLIDGAVLTFRSRVNKPPDLPPTDCCRHPLFPSPREH